MRLSVWRKSADQIEALAAEMEALTDEQLREKTEEFKERYQKGETVDDLLVEAFAVVREGASVYLVCIRSVFN